MKTKYWMIFFIIIYISSCKDQINEKEAIFNLLKDNEIDIKKDNNYAILILPINGCSTCIEPVKKFIADIDNQNFIVIISCYSIKDFKFSFNNDELKNIKYILDTEAKSFQYNLVDIGAKIYFFTQGDIKTVKKVSCTEPELVNYTRNFLKKNKKH